MTELRVIHWTDSHNQTQEYSQIIKDLIVKKKRQGTDKAIDAVIYTGDILESQHYIEDLKENKDTPLINILGREYLVAVENDSHNISNNYLLEQIPIWIKKAESDGRLKDFESFNENQRNEILQKYAIPEIKNKFLEEKRVEHFDKVDFKGIEKKIKQEYAKFQSAFDFDIPVFGVLGNHDFTSAYETLGDKIIFLENMNHAKVEGKTGVEFTLQGDNNTYEVPLLQHLMSQYANNNQDGDRFNDIFIPYLLGHTINQNQNNSIKEDNTPDSSYTNLKLLQESERERLGDTGQADIYLSHKIIGDYNPDKGHYGIGDILREYGSEANSVLGGHTHGTQIGDHFGREIDQIIANATEFEIVDGEEVAVIYLDHEELKNLNPGASNFFIVDYDGNKEIELVDLYSFN